MKSVCTKTNFEVVRVDRITLAIYPCREDISSLGEAKLIADQETELHLPLGDKFIVKDECGDTIYEPD